MEAFSPHDLLTRTSGLLKSLAGDAATGLRDEGVASGWIVEAEPVFTMTQDRRALTIDALISLRGREAKQSLRKSAVRVVSPPIEEIDAATSWGAAEGEEIKRVSAMLLARAISLSFAEWSGRWHGMSPPHRTMRFQLGGAEHIERVQVLEQGCDGVVMRTLLGDLLAVSAITAAPAAQSVVGSCNGSIAAPNGSDPAVKP